MSTKLPSAVLALALLGTTATGEEKPAEKPKKLGAPLKVQVVYSRYEGEKKVSSMPYTLYLTADDKPTFMRFGLQIPIQTIANNTPTVQFKDASTNLDCGAETLEDGRFKLALQVEQSSLFSSDAAAQRPLPGSSGLANTILHSFRSSNVLYLRDGQSAQFIAATDPTNGEVLKIDVTLSVVK
jgi:hypothetical protein